MMKKRVFCNSANCVTRHSNVERGPFGREKGTLEVSMECVEAPLFPDDSIFRLFVTVRDEHDHIVGSKAFSCLTSALLSGGCQD